MDYPRGHVYFSAGLFAIRPAGLVYFGEASGDSEFGWREFYLPETWGRFAQE